jgi:hypothetical protein
MAHIATSCGEGLGVQQELRTSQQVGTPVAPGPWRRSRLRRQFPHQAAPPRSQRPGLEWTFRLADELRPLWRRYLIGDQSRSSFLPLPEFPETEPIVSSQYVSAHIY